MWYLLYNVDTETWEIYAPSKVCVFVSQSMQEALQLVSYLNGGHGTHCPVHIAGDANTWVAS